MPNKYRRIIYTVMLVTMSALGWVVGMVAELVADSMGTVFGLLVGVMFVPFAFLVGHTTAAFVENFGAPKVRRHRKETSIEQREGRDRGADGAAEEHPRMGRGVCFVLGGAGRPGVSGWLRGWRVHCSVAVER